MTNPKTDRGTEIERVARALCAANFAKKGAEGEFGNVDDCWWAFTDDAKAAIESMSSEDEVRRALSAANDEIARLPRGPEYDRGPVVKARNVADVQRL
jgi:hypothetical protein